MSGLAHVRGEFALELLGPIRGARSVGGDVALILLGLGGADGTEQGEGSDACGGRVPTEAVCGLVLTTRFVRWVCGALAVEHGG